MLHEIFTLFNFIVLGIILFSDKKHIRKCALLFAVGLVCAFIFENLTTFLGFWYYHSEPKALLISFYTWILYVPYLGFCYFVGNRLGGMKK